jgi:hypothetical protein
LKISFNHWRAIYYKDKDYENSGGRYSRILVLSNILSERRRQHIKETIQKFK